MNISSSAERSIFSFLSALGARLCCVVGVSARCKKTEKKNEKKKKKMRKKRPNQTPELNSIQLISAPI
jgi:hypothetical protein